MLFCGWKRGCGALAWALAFWTVAPSQASESRSAPLPVFDVAASGVNPGKAPLGVADGDAASQALGIDEAGLLAADAPADVVYLRQWIEHRNDSGGLPFAIIDKKRARIHIFDDRRLLVGSSVVLIGAMPGDESVPGVGERAQTGRLAHHERTTPAGRFASQPGRNLKGEDIVWFDYEAALAIHRLRPDATHAARSKRLASATPDDNRASLGCVVVPVEFYEQVVRPWLGMRRGIVYVLPDQRPVQAWWPSHAPWMAGVADENF